MSAGAQGGPGGPQKSPTGKRWIKGQSGNPKGRPRKKETDDTAHENIGMAGLVMFECAREVTLSEGGKPVTMTAGRAVARATVVSAARGNATSQRTVLQMVALAQEARDKRQRDEYSAAILVKIQLEHDRDVWVSAGRAENDMPRHPSDLEIHPQTMTIKNFLLFTQEAVDARAEAIALRDYLIARMPEMLQTALEEEDDLVLALGCELARSTIQFINEQIPRRFRRYLPGEPVPFQAAGSPDETWRRMMRELASDLLGRGAGG